MVLMIFVILFLTTLPMLLQRRSKTEKLFRLAIAVIYGFLWSIPQFMIVFAPKAQAAIGMLTIAIYYLVITCLYSLALANLEWLYARFFHSNNTAKPTTTSVSDGPSQIPHSGTDSDR